MVEVPACKRQGHAVALDETKAKIPDAGFYAAKHGGGKVQTGITMVGRKMRQVQPGADTIDENIEITLLRQLPETCGAYALGRRCD